MAAVSQVAAATRTFTPEAAGTVTFFPILELLYVQSDADIMTMCFSTTEQNLEYRRGFFEFRLPPFPRGIVEATLTITETRGGRTSEPLPTDVHELSYYAADLVVDTADFDAPTTLIGTLETDPNDPPELRPIRFNVTDAVRNTPGRNLGFRLKLQVDPDHGCAPFAGSEFGSLYIEPPRLEIRLRPRPRSAN